MKFSFGHLNQLALSRPVQAAVCVCVCLALGACSVASGGVNPLGTASYAQLMSSAEEAQQKGGAVEALGYFEKAAKADPSKKQPWLRIAQAQFDARNYGPAITAAQEVLQRDNADVAAKSIMAASGLRVSANALEQLRQANALGGSTREEAQTLARIMRESLGESILPPVPVVVEPAKPVVRPAPTAVTAPPSTLPRRPEPIKEPPKEPAKEPAKPSRNPFEALKG